VVEQLLPLAGVTAAEEAGARPTDYLYEPSPERILDVLLQRWSSADLRALLESNARSTRADDRDGRGDAQLGGHVEA
jgi:F0F1-type ATP synthase gamma subunit